jgi:hypothetical protein
VDWSTSGFVTLPHHCRHKYLLQLPGATYSGEAAQAAAQQVAAVATLTLDAAISKQVLSAKSPLASMPEVQVCRWCGPFSSS